VGKDQTVPYGTDSRLNLFQPRKTFGAGYDHLSLRDSIQYLRHEMQPGRYQDRLTPFRLLRETALWRWITNG